MELEDEGMELSLRSKRTTRSLTFGWQMTLIKVCARGR